MKKRKMYQVISYHNEEYSPPNPGHDWGTVPGG